MGGYRLRSLSDENPHGDFRSNAGGAVRRKPLEPVESAATDAVRSVACPGLECGAVDLLADVNLRFGLAATDGHAAHRMVAHLKVKVKKP